MAAPTDGPVVELRQYRVHPELRHRLVTVFEEHFIDGQEAFGMRIVGQFIDIDRNDRFVWIREFDTMEQRRDALAGFYGGPVWQAHRDEANSTMTDSDDVLLLHPAGRWLQGLRIVGTDPRIVEVALCPLTEPVSEAKLEELGDALASATEDLVGILATHHAVNDFPTLPVREDDEHLVIVHARQPEADDSAVWQHLSDVLRSAGLPLRAPIGRLRLLPTPHSKLR